MSYLDDLDKKINNWLYSGGGNTAPIPESQRPAHLPNGGIAAYPTDRDPNPLVKYPYYPKPNNMPEYQDDARKFGTGDYVPSDPNIGTGPYRPAPEGFTGPSPYRDTPAPTGPNIPTDWNMRRVDDKGVVHYGWNTSSQPDKFIPRAATPTVATATIPSPSQGYMPQAMTDPMAPYKKLSRETQAKIAGARTKSEIAAYVKGGNEGLSDYQTSLKSMKGIPKFQRAGIERERIQAEALQNVAKIGAEERSGTAKMQDETTRRGQDITSEADKAKASSYEGTKKFEQDMQKLTQETKQLELKAQNARSDAQREEFKQSAIDRRSQIVQSRLDRQYNLYKEVSDNYSKNDTSKEMFRETEQSILKNEKFLSFANRAKVVATTGQYKDLEAIAKQFGIDVGTTPEEFAAMTPQDKKGVGKSIVQMLLTKSVTEAMDERKAELTAKQIDRHNAPARDVIDTLFN